MCLHMVATAVHLWLLTVRELRDFMANNGSTEASQGLEFVCHDLTTEAARWMQYYHDAGD